MNWVEFQLAVASLNADPVPLGSMSGVAHDNATRDILGPPPGRALNNDHASLTGSLVRGDFVWTGPGAGRVQADGAGGHPLLLGMRTGFCAGRIEDYGFFFHSGHFHPEVEHAIPFLVDFIRNSCALLHGGPRDLEVDRLSNLELRFYRKNSSTEIYSTTFAELAVTHRVTPIVHISTALDTEKGPITGYREGPWGMKIPLYGPPVSLSLGSAPSTSSSEGALSLHGGFGLLPGPQHPSPKFEAKPTFAELPPPKHVVKFSAPRVLSVPPSSSSSSSSSSTTVTTAPIGPFDLGVTPTGRYFAGLRLGRAIWMPDSERTSCARCHTVFTRFTRKHHCRKCGDLVCGNCSGQKRIVHMPATEPKGELLEVTASAVRVCSACVHRIDL